MAKEYDLTPVFPFGTINQRGRDTDRSPAIATDSLNIDYFDGSDDATCRLGMKAVGDNSGNVGGFGAWLYSKFNSDGTVTTEKLIAGTKLYRVKTATLTLGYVGSGASVVCSHLVDETTNKWTFVLTVDDVAIITIDNNVGYDHASIGTVNDVKTTVDAHADFTAAFSAGAVTSVPGAFLPVLFSEPFVSGSLVISYLYNELVNQPTTAANPFAGSATNQNLSTFENISSLEKNGVRYFANGYDRMKKYDSADIYNAGLPKPADPTVTAATGSVGSGSWPDVYEHKYTYIQHDAIGNIIEGPISDSDSTSISSASNFTVTVTNLLAASGYNTDCALVNGAGQNNVTTITVDNGSGGSHTMKVGQTAYFYDSVTGSYVERSITAKAATTITISGSAVTVADNAVISNNLRIAVYRTEADGTVFNLLKEIPNNSFTSTQTYVDATVDTSLSGGEYSDPESLGAEHTQPPYFKYLATYGDIGIGIGALSSQQDIAYSDIDSIEYWPARNVFTLQGARNTPWTGGAESGPFLFLFKEDETWAVAGDLTSGAFDKRRMSGKIGCTAHSSIVEYDTYVCWQGLKSYYLSDNGAAPVDIGSELTNFFKIGDKETTQQFKLKRTVAIEDSRRGKVLWFVPCETTTSGSVAANTNSRVFVYDFYRKGWLKWDARNMAGGAFRDGENMYWVERRYSTFSSAMVYQLYQRLNNGTLYDYADHVTAIAGSHTAGWVAHPKTGCPMDLSLLRVYANNEFVSSNYSLSVITEVNWLPGITHTEGTLSFGSASTSVGWSLGPWGDSPWGDPADNQTQDLELNADSVKSLRLMTSFSNLYDIVVLSGYQLEVTSPYELHFDRKT